MGASDLRRVVVWKRGWLPGSETFIRNQVGSLPAAWAATCVGTHLVESPLARGTDRIIFPPTRTGYVRRRMLDAFGWSHRVLRAVARERPDLIHAHFATDARVVRRVARRLAVPFVVTVHGQDLTGAPRVAGLRGALLRSRLRRTLRQADIVIAVSDFMAAQAVRCGARPDRVRVHHVGIPIIQTGIASTKTWDLVFVGRLVEKKGIEDLIDATARLPAGSVRVAIVGDGPLRQRLEERCSDTGVSIDFLGSMSSEEVSSVLSRSRIFVGPSRTAPSGDAEGFGMVFLEAALHGLPVVAYRHGGVPEAVEDGVTGIMVPEGSVALLTEAIARLLADPEQVSQMGSAGRERTITRFNVAKQTMELARIYDEAVRLNRGGAR